MGLNYERGVAEALHAYGHRAESIMRHVYGSWNSSPYDDDPGQPQHAWDRFALIEGLSVEGAGCGTIPPAACPFISPHLAGPGFVRASQRRPPKTV
jgi:hypothetical protein